MKITRRQLRRIIRETLFREAPDYVYGMIKDYEDWVVSQGHVTPSASSVMASYFMELGMEGDHDAHQMLADHFGVDHEDVMRDIERQQSERAASLHEAMQPLMDPLFNMREMCKEFTLLEDHLNQPDMQCQDCINKHLMKCEALAEEAISLDAQRQYPFIEEIPAIIRSWHEFALEDGPLTDLAPMVRELRKELTPLVADRFETN